MDEAKKPSSSLIFGCLCMSFLRLGGAERRKKEGSSNTVGF